MDRPPTLLCLACYFKGARFLEKAKELGCRVLLVTSHKLENEDWPRQSIDEIYLLDEKNERWDMERLVRGVSYLSRTERIDRIVALDDYDVEKAAHLREHFRMPGISLSQSRYFRDKLAMRDQAKRAGILVPDYTPLFHHPEVEAFCARVPPPWVLKPRSEASATGIKKLGTTRDVWAALEKLGDNQAFCLLEHFIPGRVYHVDSLVFAGQVRFARAHGYLDPPMQVAHEGGIFCSTTVDYGSSLEDRLLELNQAVIESTGLRRGVSHTEFIQAEDGQFFFLETSARVGGANIAEMVEASSGLNLWAEWACLEALHNGEEYRLPEVRHDHAGIIISLARQQAPDTSRYDDPEIVWRLKKRHHVGLIVRAGELPRIHQLLEQYSQRFMSEFHAVQPLPEKPTA